MANGRSQRDRTREPLAERVAEKVRGFRNPRTWWLPVTFGLMLLVLGVTVAAINNPAATGSNLPQTEDAVGRVAVSDVRAPISFNVPDVESTERKRQEAEAAIRSVYDFEQEFGNQQIRRLREAFGDMQTLFREHDKALEALEGEDAADPQGAAEDQDADRPSARPRRPRKAHSHQDEKHAAELAKERARLDEELEARLAEAKGEFLKQLQVVIKDEDFQRLKQERFSVETLNAIAGLVEKNMRHMIVASRELLTADRTRGITVRFLAGGVPQREMVVAIFARIQDLEEALERVEQSAALDLAGVPAPLKAAEIRVAKALMAPNMFFNREETARRKREARENVEPLEISYKKDEIIVRSGEKIQHKHIRAFQQMARLTEVSNAMQMALGTVMLVVVLLLGVAWFSTRNVRKFRTQPKDLGLLALVMFVSLVSVKVWFWIFGAVWDQFQLFPLESYYFAIPFAAGAMLIRFVLNSETALAFAAAFSLLAGLVMDSSIGWTTYCLVSSLVAASAVGQVRQRTSLLYAGALTGLANMLLAVGLSLSSGTLLSFETIFSALFAFSGGILAAIIITGVAPLIEVAFGYTTDIKLLELANLNHPLLKELIVQAPGSYHHSIIVGSLVEAGAEAIHCNPLLARVMAYYHDIGKVKKPAYFSENQRDGVNRHDKLKPSLSASVLRAHVKDGAELAREYRLGQPIVDAIVEHHGTSLMKFFYQRAKDQAEEEELVKEEDFRYPGPKPQSREVALVMLADSVEAAAKSISDPSPARLQGLVQNMINRIFVDGQLDECELTLQDLHQIARAFNRVLAGIYHHRPDYPEPATRDVREQKDASGERKPEKKPEKKGEKKGEKKNDSPPDKKKKADGPAESNGKKEGEEKRQETPDEGEENIKRLGI